MGSATLVLPNIEDYDICPYLGFAAGDGVLLQSLPSYYDPWNDILSNLLTLLKNKTLRQQVRSMPLLITKQLVTEAHFRRAYLTLAMLTQAYVFAEYDQPEEIVPPALAEPFLEVCTYWGLQPVLSLIGYCLWNWKLKDIDGFKALEKGNEISSARVLLLSNLSNVESCASFTGTIDEKAFALVPLLVEAEGGCMVAMLLDSLRAADRDDIDEVTRILSQCVTKLTAMAEYLPLLHQLCNPQFFYDQIRPYIAGSQGKEDKGLPQGFIFELSNGERVPSKCVGASAGQSSLFQFLDHIFGIEHQSEFHRSIRKYMPIKHRQFLEAVESVPGLRPFVEQHPENERLQSCFDQCIVHLREWRTKHIGLVMRYVMMPAKRAANQEEVKGTAGSSPIPLLKAARDETV